MGISGGKFSLGDDFSLSEVFGHSLKYIWDGGEEKENYLQLFPHLRPHCTQFLKDNGVHHTHQSVFSKARATFILLLTAYKAHIRLSARKRMEP